MFRFQILTTIMFSSAMNLPANPNIIWGLVTAIVGPTSAWILGYGAEYYKFNKKKNGVYRIIASEIENNNFNLEKYEIYHPVKDIQYIKNKWTIGNLQNFYNTLNDFPNITHNNWDKFIEIVPEIFDETEIRKIIEVNANLDKLSDLVKSLSNYTIKYSINQENMDLNALHDDDFVKITENYKIFKKNYAELKKGLKEINTISKEKRTKMGFLFDLKLFIPIIIEIILIICTIYFLI